MNMFQVLCEVVKEYKINDEIAFCKTTRDKYMLPALLSMYFYIFSAGIYYVMSTYYYLFF